MGVYLGSNPVGFMSYIAGGSEQENALVERTLTTYENSMISQVGNYTFAYCTGLASVNLPLATTIGDNAFQFCRSLVSISLPSATSIGSYAFQNCSRLASINLPSATTIGMGAFTNCSALISINLFGSSVPYLQGVNAFTGTPISEFWIFGKYGSIYVPASLYSDYIASTNWAAYSSRFVSIQ